MGGIPGNYVQPRGEHELDWNYLLLGCLQANVEEFNQRCLRTFSFHVVHLFSSTVHFPRLQRLLNQPICLMYKCTQQFYFFIWCLRKHLYEGSQLNMSLLYIYCTSRDSKRKDKQGHEIAYLVLIYRIFLCGDFNVTGTEHNYFMP